MNIIELINIVKDGGIAGAGGAGFPTYAKLDKRTDTILLNCAECEPLLKVHRQLLEKYAYEILSTLNLMAEAVEASEVLIGVKAAYKKTVEAVEASLDVFPKIKIVILPEIYPAGDEVVLIYEATKKVVPPGKLPIQVGVTVFNVETVLNIYKALEQKEPVIYKYLTIAGEVKTPVTLKAPIGMTVKELVKLAGGATVEDAVYIMGGPMTGNIVSGYEVVTKTTNAILVFPKHHTVVNKKTHNISIDMKRAMSVCCQCQMCTDLCPRNQLGHPIEPHAFMRAATSGISKDLAPFLNTMFCCSCGLCEMYACGQDLSPRTLIMEYKNGLKKNGVGMPAEIPVSEVNSLREYRKVPAKRIIARLGLESYNTEALLTEEEVPVQSVKINLSQHIGAPAKAVVKAHDIVHIGQIIGQAQEEKLSIPVHASISGEVMEVNEKYIIIKTR